MCSSSAGEGLQADINKFVGGLNKRKFPPSLVDIEAFAAEKTHKSWHTHCLHMNEDWHHLIEKMHEIAPELKVNELAKLLGKKIKALRQYLKSNLMSIRPNLIVW